MLSGLPRSTSPPILWAFSGSAVSMQSWTIKGKLWWPPTVLWESAALASSAYFDQCGYKWTFTCRQFCKDSPGPSSHISPFNIPYLKRPGFSEQEVLGGMHFFRSREQKKQLVVSGQLPRDVYNSNLDGLSETFCPQRFCRDFFSSPF